MAVYFTPTPLLGGPGCVQQITHAKSQNVAYTRGPNGAASPCGHDAFNLKLSREEVYFVFAEAGGFFTVPAVGSISAAGYHIDNVNVAWGPGAWPTVKIRGHIHGQTRHPPVTREYLPSVFLPTGWGVVPRFAGDGAVSIVYDLSAYHFDAPDERGNIYAADTSQGLERIDAETVVGPLSPPETGDWLAIDNGGDASLMDAASYRVAWIRPF